MKRERSCNKPQNSCMPFKSIFLNSKITLFHEITTVALFGWFSTNVSTQYMHFPKCTLINWLLYFIISVKKKKKVLGIIKHVLRELDVSGHF